MPVDKRILNLSYSGLLTLHTCPRRFQLHRLNAEQQQLEFEDVEKSVTFAYGHVVGDGIQNIIQGKSIDAWMFEAFMMWDADLLASNPKQNKSFFGAIHALRQFSYMFDTGYLGDYEIVMWNGKPAAELSFSIALPDGFVYRGFVDAVLRSKSSGKVLVLECKTTNSSSVNPALYKNSAQAIGYSIVLDAIFPELSSYEVLYLVYQSKAESYVQLPFDKSYYQRALWIRELLLDVEMIKLYESNQIYPMHGESCFTYNRECEYLQTCTLPTERLMTPMTDEMSERIDKDLDAFQIKITLNDLIAAQLNKNNIAEAERMDDTGVMIGTEEDMIL